ncbi:hypothetical protein NIES4102_30210 [Chondrocystis sp. NIES-4102]|nr:hypothetical protein NIES4102_30210 [Chondrocystis sp. NIES-4102]
MSIIRSLESFSLPELFKLIEKNSKSGRLIIETPISNRNAKREGIYYLWFQEGNFIAISDCLNQTGLINLIASRGWLSPLIIAKLRTLCPASVPLGTYLSKMKLLNKQNISLLFQLQLHQVYRLFQLTGGRFRFDDFSNIQTRILTIPWLEMTGHQMKTTEVTMYALRLMVTSQHITQQLPESNLALKRIVDYPHLKLTALEHRLWDLADGQMSLIEIAKTTQEPLLEIQITAFRLIAVGLVSEIFQSSYDWKRLNSEETRKEIPAYNHGEQLPKIYEDQRSLLQTLGAMFKNFLVE